MKLPIVANTLRGLMKWAAWLLICFLIASAAFALAWFKFDFKEFVLKDIFPMEMNATRYSEKNVVANLGGIPVSIPPYFAEFVEYDGDPGFGEKRIEKKPVRTPQSKLKSFGFYMRYPDMAGLSSPELKKIKPVTLYTTQCG